jgi:hypothetical protein
VFDKENRDFGTNLANAVYTYTGCEVGSQIIDSSLIEENPAMTEQQDEPQLDGGTTPSSPASSGEVGWLLKPGVGSGISIYIVGVAEVEHLTPEVLQALDRQMREQQGVDRWEAGRARNAMLSQVV